MQAETVVIFVPGIEKDAPLQSSETIGGWIAQTLNDASPTNTQPFTLSRIEEVSLTTARADKDGLYPTVKVGHIEKKDSKGKNVPFAEVVKVRYYDELVAPLNTSNPFERGWLTFTQVLSFTWRTFAAFRPQIKATSYTQRIQILLASLMLVAMYIYMFSVVIAAGEQITTWVLGEANSTDTTTSSTITPTPTPTLTPTAAPTATQGSSPNDRAGGTKIFSDIVNMLLNTLRTLNIPRINVQSLAKTIASITVIASAITVLVRPHQDGILRIMLNLGTRCVALVAYLTTGTVRPRLTQHLEDVMKFVAYRETPPKQIYLVGYSFGTIFIFDTLFPAYNSPDPVFLKINKIVTIGSPFDFLRTLYPLYIVPERRKAPSDWQAKWLNIYAEYDLLSSNFRDTPNAQNAEPATAAVAVRDTADSVAIKPDENYTYDKMDGLTWFDKLGLIGLKTHRVYWNLEIKDEKTAWRKVVDFLFANQILGQAPQIVPSPPVSSPPVDMAVGS